MESSLFSTSFLASKHRGVLEVPKKIYDTRNLAGSRPYNFYIPVFHLRL